MQIIYLDEHHLDKITVITAPLPLGTVGNLWSSCFRQTSASAYGVVLIEKLVRVPVGETESEWQLTTRQI